MFISTNREDSDSNILELLEGYDRVYLYQGVEDESYFRITIYPDQIEHLINVLTDIRNNMVKRSVRMY